jgi:DNA-binding GntR family transcriptional regulator
MSPANFHGALSEIPSISKVQHVQRAILLGIFRGEIRPGDRLVEANLAKRLGVSQTTVNQALQDLHAQGIVNKSMNRATTVCLYGTPELEALFLVRSELECMAAHAAASNLTPEGVDKLRFWVEQMRTAARTKDLPNFYLADYEFHQALYQMSQNRFLIHACQAITAAPFAYILCNRVEPLHADYAPTAEDHEDIVEALLAGPKAAVELVRSKVNRWFGWQSEFLARK